MSIYDLGVLFLMITINSLLNSLALTYIFHNICYKGEEKTLKNFGIPLMISYTIMYILISVCIFK